jgi:NADPH-dependent FMN reductase
MDGIVRILGIPGSLRKASFNRAALRAAEELVPADASLEIFDLEGIPPFSEDDERALPTRVVELKARIREADAILIATPEYNYSIPGVLKNAIDWASRPYGDNAWDGKPVAIMGASVGGTGTARAQFEVDEGGSLNAWRAATYASLPRRTGSRRRGGPKRAGARSAWRRRSEASRTRSACGSGNPREDLRGSADRR